MHRFKQEPDAKIKSDLKKIDEKLKNEKDKYKRMKLLEQKLTCDLFANTNMSFGRYKNPW